MSKQLLRSATSVGANIREAQNAESNMDFIHKLAIAQIYKADYISEAEFTSVYSDANEILKMLRSAILTTKNKSKLK